MHKYVKFVETRFHELKHEPKMRLLKTHSHTSERRGYEADKKRQEKREKGGLSVGDRKNGNENHCRITCKGGGRGEAVSTETRRPQVAPRSSATTLTKGGAAKIISPKKENTKSHAVLYHSRSSQILQIAPGSGQGGNSRTKKKRARRTDCPVPQLNGPITQTTAQHLGGCIGRMKYARTTPNRPKN